MTIIGLTFHSLSTAQRQSYFCRYTPIYIIERVKGSSAVHKFDLFPDDVTSHSFHRLLFAVRVELGSIFARAPSEATQQNWLFVSRVV
jgi:hypothetical protein